MASFLNMLAQGLAGAGGIAGPLDETDFISVQAPRSKVGPSRADKYRDLVDSQIDAPDMGMKTPKEMIPRQGMFGVKGTLRDILGTVGDMLLVGNNADPIYRPQRQREKMGDAMFDFTENPLEAIERLAAGGFTKEAQELHNQYQTKTLNQSKLDQALKAAEDERYQQYVDLYTRTAGAMTPETFERMRPLLETYRRRGGLGDEFSVPDQFDPNWASSLGRAGMKTSQQITTDLRRRQIEGTEEYRQKRIEQEDRKEQGRRERDNDPQPTRTSIAAPILRAIEEGKELTPAQQKVLDRVLPERRRTNADVLYELLEDEETPAPKTSSKGGNAQGQRKMVIRNGQLVFQ